MESGTGSGINPHAIVQWSYAKGTGFNNIWEYLQSQMDKDDFDPDATLVGVSIPDESKVFCLNAVASFVLEAVFQGKDVDWMCQGLGQLFDVDQEVLRGDVVEILEDFRERRILV